MALALVVAGAGTLVLARLDARRSTVDDVAQQAEASAGLLRATGRLGATDTPLGRQLRVRLIRAFGLTGVERVVITRAGTVRGTLPAGVAADDLDLATLLAGTTDDGTSSSVAFAAVPLDPRPGGATPVLVATREIRAGFGSAGRWFLLAAALSLAGAVLVAARLGDRLTRPLTAAEATTRRIAAGDFGARLPDPGPPADELASLAASINRMAAELERQRGLERQFLLSVSHDLRTPLTSIRGYAEAIADRATEPGEAAAVILGEARRLERLVGDLLDLAKLEAHRFSLTLEPLDAAATLLAVADSLQPVADDDGLRIEREVAGALGVRADPDRLAQVVANLVENALKFARHQVRVSGTRGDGDVLLAVDDDGPGIDPADLPFVFERLYSSTRQPAREVGTGLGLAIVRELTEAMGGSVAAEPSSLGGARLVVSLPAEPSSAAAPHTTTG